MKNNRGFTLVELLSVIVILAIIAGITAVVAIEVISRIKEKSYQVTIKNIEKNAGAYVDEYELYYVANSENDTEYQCITVRNLVDAGFLKNNITESKVAADRYVSLGDFVYIERDTSLKSITKTKYDNDSETLYDLCDDANNIAGNIILSSSPSFNTWSKSKDITIRYQLRNPEPNIVYDYVYDYSGEPYDVVSDDGKVKVITVTRNGVLNASITSTVISQTKEVTKIDNIGPSITNEYSGVNPVKNTVTIPLKVTDIGIGVDEASFTKDDLTVMIGTTQVTNSNITLNNLTNGNYNLVINNPSNASLGKVTIIIPANKVFDKLGNGNEEVTIETVTFSDSYELIYNCDGGYDGPVNQQLIIGHSYAISTNGCKKKGYHFTGWFDASGNERTGETGTWNTQASLEVIAHYEENRVNISYNMNGGELAAAHGSGVSIENNLLKYEGTTILHSLKYDEELSSAGLWNWNNPSYLNVVKGEYSAIKGQEWNTASNGSGTSYAQDVVYSAVDFCPNIEHESCDVTLYVNWDNVSRPIRIYYHTNGGTLNNNNFALKNNWLIQKNTSMCVSGAPSATNDTLFKDSEGYCYQAGYNGQNIDLWNYNNSSYIDIKKSGTSAVSGKEWYTKVNGNKVKFNQNTAYTYAWLRQYCRTYDEYYELSLYVNWSDSSSSSSTSGYCCQYNASYVIESGVEYYTCPSGGGLSGRTCIYKTPGSCVVGWSILC